MALAALLCLALLILPFVYPAWITRFYINISTVILQNALWQDDHSAIERQRSASHAANLLLLAAGREKDERENETGPNVPDAPSDSMIPALLRAEHYRRAGDFGVAARWLQQAASAEPYPSRQKSLVFPATIKVAADGAIIIDSSTPGWRSRRDSPASATVEATMQGSIVLSWESVPGQRKRGVYAWSNPFHIPYHHTMLLEIKVEEGCHFAFETVIDGKRERNIRHSGTGQWEEVRLSVEGEQVRFLYALLDAESEDRTRCQMEIKSISFVLDHSAVNANPS